METVIRVGPEPDRYAAEADYFDGSRAVPEPVALAIDEDAAALVLTRADAAPIRWPLDAIREIPDQAGRDMMVLRLRDDPVARLVLRTRDLEPRLAFRTGRAPVTRRGRLVGWGLAAIASVALIVFVLVPQLADRLAVYVPPEGERALGEVTLGQIRSALGEDMHPVEICDGPRGRQALEAMRGRLVAAADLPHPLTLHVLDHEMVNAFALPGGYVVLFRGLVEAAETPEELAAVVAHEIGHIAARDPTRHALRSAGSIGVLGLILGDFAGGAAVLFLVNQLIEAQYSQSAETAADTFAHDLLAESGVDPAALGAMFRTFRDLEGDHDGAGAHFLSHPALSARIAEAEAATPAGFVNRPLMGAEAWRALRAICR